MSERQPCPRSEEREISRYRLRRPSGLELRIVGAVCQSAPRLGVACSFCGGEWASLGHSTYRLHGDTTHSSRAQRPRSSSTAHGLSLPHSLAARLLCPLGRLFATYLRRKSDWQLPTGSCAAMVLLN